MTLDPKNVAARLEAEHVGQMPDVGGGAFGMARLAAALKERLEPAPGRRPGRPTMRRSLQQLVWQRAGGSWEWGEKRIP